MGKKKRLKAQRSKHSIQEKVDAPKALTNASLNVGEILKWLCLALIVFLIYSNTLGSPFLFDDVHVIPDNRDIRLSNLTMDEITRAAFGGPSSYRPVAKISFALNYYFHRYNVLGYHLVNILIHITTGILLYLFVQMTLGILSRRSGYTFYNWIPFFTALIWLVHPIQTQSVSYIVQRMNSMAAMFYILSLLLYGKARLTDNPKKKGFLFAACIISGLLSFGSKEIAATLPFFLFLYEWYFFKDLNRDWLKRHLLPIGGILLILLFVSFLYLGGNPFEKILADYKTYPFTLTERVLTEFRVVIYYISLLILPHPSRLNVDYDFSISHSLMDPTSTLLCLLLIAGLIGLALYRAKKGLLLSFAILWFFGNLVIESSVIGLDIIFEHRTYLPSMFVCLLVVTLMFRYIKPKGLSIGVLCAVTIIFSLWAYERNGVWRDDMTLWADCSKKSPNKARPHTNLGVALWQRGKTKEAMEHYSIALRINPNYIDAHNNLGIILRRQGRLEEAATHFSAVLRIDPDYREAHNNLGNTFSGLGRFDNAIIHYKEALRIDPHDAIAHYNLGNVLGNQEKFKEARTHYEAAIRIKPDFPEARRNLQRTLQLISKSVDLNKAIVRK
jgi:tetratricopeptide (TPR) repeat protein